MHLNVSVNETHGPLGTMAEGLGVCSCTSSDSVVIFRRNRKQETDCTSGLLSSSAQMEAVPRLKALFPSTTKLLLPHLVEGFIW